MIVYTFVFFIIVFFAVVASICKKKLPLYFSFLFIFIFSAIRYDIGNDYSTYERVHSEINKMDFYDFNYVRFSVTVENNGVSFFEDVSLEKGWILLCKIIPNFRILVILIAFFLTFTFAHFTLRYNDLGYIWIAILIYLFHPNDYIMQQTAFRQCFAANIFLMSLYTIYNKQWMFYCILIIVASLVHASAMILLPFYFVSLIHVKQKRIPIIILLAIIIPFVGLPISFEFFKSVFSQIPIFSSYIFYLSVGKVTIFRMLFIASIIVIFGLNINAYNDFRGLLVKMGFISGIIWALTTYLGGADRIFIYFSVLIAIALPLVIIQIKSIKLQMFFIIWIFIFLYRNYYSFFSPESLWFKGFIPYKTIFD